MKPVIVAALVLIGGAGSASAEDAFLAKLAGAWTGRGTMQTSPEAAPERVYCKIENTLADNGETLRQAGRCSLASNSGPIDGTIAAMGSNLYGGELASLASRGPAEIAGSLNGGRLELNADFVDTLDGKPARSVIAIDFVSNGYRLTSTRTDPKTGAPYTASEIIFSK